MSGNFLAMGGYGAFIWPAYGVSVLALIGIAWQSWAAWRAAKKKLDALEQDGP
jgi:heme exporter protein D